MNTKHVYPLTGVGGDPQLWGEVAGLYAGRWAVSALAAWRDSDRDPSAVELVEEALEEALRGLIQEGPETKTQRYTSVIYGLYGMATYVATVADEECHSGAAARTLAMFPTWRHVGLAQRRMAAALFSWAWGSAEALLSLIDVPMDKEDEDPLRHFHPEQITDADLPDLAPLADSLSVGFRELCQPLAKPYSRFRLREWFAMVLSRQTPLLEYTAR